MVIFHSYVKVYQRVRDLIDGRCMEINFEMQKRMLQMDVSENLGVPIGNF
jgi:hypothetical protein